jgi:protein-disulfide isomerase
MIKPIIIPLLLKMKKIATIMILVASSIVLWNLKSGWSDDVVIDYEGSIKVDDVPYSGTGKFKFALASSNGRILWSNSDNTPPIEPIPQSLTIKIPVVNGTYSVRLGDAKLGMTSIDGSIFAKNQDVRLRFWFDDGSHGMQELGSYRLPKTSITSSFGKEGDALSVIIKEMRQIRKDLTALRRRVDGGGQQAHHRHGTAPEKVSLPLQERPVMGNPESQFVLIEFTDYQCTYCKRFYQQTFAELKMNYIDTGKLHFVSRNFPLKFHKNAEFAANATLCAGDQGKYWDMRKMIFNNRSELSKDEFKRYATEIGIDLSRFETCLSKQDHLSEIQQDIKDAHSIGIMGTPSFVLGKKDGKMIKGEKLVGALPYRELESRIKELLSKKGSKNDNQITSP